MATTYKRIKAVATTLEILECLADSRAPLTGSQVAERVGMPGPTVMCHLATLQDGGYVQGAGEKYRIGMKLAVFWAHMKARKEDELKSVQNDLAILGGNR